MNEKHFNDLSQETQLQIWQNNELLEWLNAKARKEEHLEQQLQAYKDKEDKLREYIKTWHFEEHFDRDYEVEICSNDILQILNEGDKK